MTQNIPLNKNDVAIEPFWDATQEYLGAGAPSFRLSVTNATTVTCSAGTGNDQVAIAIEGRYRFRTTNTTASPSGGAGVKDIWVIGTDNDFSGLPVDNTVYAFTLTITASGSPPVATIKRKVGEVDWDGAAITAIRLMTGIRYDADPVMPTAPHAAHTPLRVRGAASQSANLITAEDSSAVAKFSVSATGAGTFAGGLTIAASGLTIGSGTIDYASSAIHTASNVTIDGNLKVGTSGTTLGFYGATPQSQVTSYNWTGSGAAVDRVLDGTWTMADLRNMVYSIWKDLKAMGLLAGTDGP